MKKKQTKISILGLGKNFLIQHAPYLGAYKRYVIALLHKIMPIRASYSQHGEDAILLQLLESLEDEIDIDYVDVGANHPSDISNTYLLYRTGRQGWLIEPNDELCRLLISFRPFDVTIQMGVGDIPSVKLFHVSRTPVGSSFDEQHFQSRMQALHRLRHVPVLRIDQALKDKKIGVLNIDVEGWNYKALISSEGIINNVSILCIEYDSECERQKMLSLLTSFELIYDSGLNLICKRSSDA